MKQVQQVASGLLKKGISKADLLKYAWTKRKDLSYLLHSGQKIIRNSIANSPRQEQVILCSRRWGKSYLAAVLAIEAAMAKSYSRILIVCPTLKEAENIFVGHIEMILADSPSMYNWSFNQTKKKWTLWNKSVIVLGGTDNKNSDRLRGTKADLIIIDEAGMCSDFEYLVESVLRPQTLTTGGKIIMCSTPSVSVMHPFMARYVNAAEERGELNVYTVYDAPHLSAEVIEKLKEEAGGEETTSWRREYMCEKIVEETIAIVPEFDKMKKELVVEHSLPRYFQCYTVADFGFNDLTVVGFWEYLFDEGLLYCRDELVFKNQGTAMIAPAIRERELKLWGRQADKRYGDPNTGNSNSQTTTGTRKKSVIALADFHTFHDLHFSPVNRSELQQTVNKLREAITRKELNFHPRCHTTISHMKGGIWNDSRTSFERSAGTGHFDAIAMVMYANKHIDRQHNPNPIIPPGLNRNDIAVSPAYLEQRKSQGQTLEEFWYNQRKKKR